jgi:2-dehydropantoate 2-reductase
LKRERIGIVGAGALGCTIATILALAGYDVELAKVYKSQLLLPKQPAFEVGGEFGEFTAIINTCDGIDKFSNLKDFIFIVPKATDVKKCVSMALKYLSPNGKIVTLQNVLTIDDVLATAPREKVLGWILGWTVARLSPTQFTVQSKGINIIGSFCPNMERDILALKDVLTNISDTYAYKNFMGIAISRLIINSCISSLGCITGARLGTLMTLKNVKKLFEGLFKEDMERELAKGRAEERKLLA